MAGPAVNEGTILLRKYDDFETQVLPGGSFEEAEAIAQAALRET
jgi:8-oxo-dGTP pyrophosphatase MutT (NUDIX family)